MRMKPIYFLFALIGFGLTNMGCSSSDNLGSGDLVTVSGTVVNLDTISPASGVKVYLYKHDEDAYRTVTDDLGAFSLKLPKGTVYHLVTDDADGSASDDWVKLINVELYKPFVNDGFSGYQIHACPTPNGAQSMKTFLATQVNNANYYSPILDVENLPTPSTPDPGTGYGSVAVWDNYLAGADGQARYPGVTSTALAGGMISIAMYQYSPGVVPAIYAPDVKVTTDSESEFGPISYFDITRAYGYAQAAAVPSQQNCDVDYLTAAQPTSSSMIDTALDKTGANHFVLSFGKPTFKGDKVTLTFSNEIATTRTVTDFPSKVEVPVEAGAISLIIFGWSGTDGVTYQAKPFGDFFADMATEYSNIATLAYCHTP